jgi:four helix bundle protein
MKVERKDGLQNFEKLEVWQKAVRFANLCYQLTSRFPKEEMFGLTSVSISANIAEGSSRSSRLDFSRFIEIATGSAFESFSLLTIAKEQHFINPENFKPSTFN